MYPKEQIESLESETTPVKNLIDWDIIEDVLQQYQNTGNFNTIRTMSDKDCDEIFKEEISEGIIKLLDDFSKIIERDRNWDEAVEKKKLEIELKEYGITDSKIIKEAFKLRIPDSRITNEYENILNKFRGKEVILANEFIQWFQDLNREKLEIEDWDTKYDFLSRTLSKVMMNYFEIHNKEMSKAPLAVKLSEMGIEDIISGQRITPLFLRKIIFPLMKKYQEIENEIRNEYVIGIGIDNWWFQYTDDVFIIIEALLQDEFEIKIISYSFDDNLEQVQVYYLENLPVGEYPFSIDRKISGIIPEDRYRRKNNIVSPYPKLFDKILELRVIYSEIFTINELTEIKDELQQIELIEDYVSIYLDDKFNKWRLDTIELYQKQAVANVVFPIITDPMWFSNMNSLISKFEEMTKEMKTAKEIMMKYFISQDSDLNKLVNIIKTHGELNRDELLTKWVESEAQILGKNNSESFKNKYRNRLRNQESALEKHPHLQVIRVNKSKRGGPKILIFTHINYDDEPKVKNLIEKEVNE